MAPAIKPKADSKAEAGLAQTLESVGRPLINAVAIAIPFIIIGVSRLHSVFRTLPQNALFFLYGTIICFFGGTFPTLFAALKAAEHGGRKTVAQALTALAEEAMVIVEASKKDDKVDADKDGKSDANQTSGHELLTRTTLLVLKKMNPQKIDDALASIYKVWLAVMAVLSIQFARTVSLSLTMANFLERPCKRFIQPVITHAIPKDYRKWVPVVLGWVCKSVAMGFAWNIQTVISAVASSLDGGLMMARAFYALCVAHKLHFLGTIPDNHEDSYLDEMFSYMFASMGVYFQFKIGFDLPFPLSVLLWPFRIVEYYIRWSIT